MSTIITIFGVIWLVIAVWKICGMAEEWVRKTLQERPVLDNIARFALLITIDSVEQRRRGPNSAALVDAVLQRMSEDAGFRAERSAMIERMARQMANVLDDALRSPVPVRRARPRQRVDWSKYGF